MGADSPLPPGDPLVAGFERGTRACGDLGLPFADYERAVDERVRSRLRRAGLDVTLQAIRDVLPRTNLADLYLAVACDASLPGAWESFERVFRRRLVALALEAGAAAEDAEAVVAELSGRLVCPPVKGGARTRIGTYDGSASLFTWLASIVLHGLADRRRGRGHLSLEALLREEEDGRRVAGCRAAADPLVLAAGAEAGRRLREGLRLAWDRLTPRESVVLLWKYRDGLAQTEIARVLGVGPPRVTRLLQAGIAKVREAVRDRMPGVAEGDGWAGLWGALAEAAGEHLAGADAETPSPRG